jgi:hypothetical protein
LLARLTLKGNAIRSNDNPNVYLNGAATAVPGTGLQLPSGDGRPWADFEMWFWLISQPLVVFSPNIIQFDPQNVKATSPAQTITVTNSGITALTVSVTDPDFAAEVTPPNVTVPAGTVATPTIGTISVTFTPTTTGSLSGNVNIIGAASGNLQVPLIGTGIARI